MAGVTVAAKATLTAIANRRDFSSGFDDVSAPPTTAPLGAFTSSDATCMTPSVRLKTMR
jgi:hypothetical protein